MTNGRLIGRTKGGMNTKLHAVADGRPIRFFMTAGQVSDYTGAAALLAGCHRQNGCWPTGAMTPTGSEKRWKTRGYGRASRAGSLAPSPSATTSVATNAATGSRSCSADSRTGDGLPPATAEARRCSSPP